MPRRKKNSEMKESGFCGSNVSEMFNPIAASSPMVGSWLITTMDPIQAWQKNIIKEQNLLKKGREIKQKCYFLKLGMIPNSICSYYNEKDDKSHGVQVNGVNNNQNKVPEKVLMPPPSIPKGKNNTTLKTKGSDSEVELAAGRMHKTRSSTRISNRSQSVDGRPYETQTIIASKKRSISESRQNVVQLNDVPLVTPIPRGRKRGRNIAMVTPGPNVNAPQTILRRPTPGEKAISLDGSPLLVTTELTAAVPQMSIPLSDGKVMAVLGTDDSIDPDYFPAVDPVTMKRLKVLREFIDKLDKS